MNDDAPGMNIRAATIADKPVWLALRRRLRPTLSDRQHEQDWQQMLEQRGRRMTLLCVDLQGGLLGLVEISQRGPVEELGSGPVASVDVLHVEQGEARDATAQRLVDAAAQWAKTRGCRLLASDTSLDNQWEQKLHEALGFEEVARKVVYRKVLAEPALAPRRPAPAPGPVPVAVADVEAVAAADTGYETASRWWPGPVRGGIIVAGILSLIFTDVFSGGIFVGVILPIVDVIFFIYLLMLFVGMRYRRTTRADEIPLELYQAPNDRE